MLVTSVHAKFEANAIKIARSKRSKCEVPNEGNLAQVQDIAII